MRLHVFYFLVAGCLPAVSILRAAEPAFPVVGAEYLIPTPKRVLPPGACDDGHIVIVEEGKGSWVRVAYHRPSPMSWKPPEIAYVWINLDHIPWLEEVAPDCCRLHISPHH